MDAWGLTDKGVSRSQNQDCFSFDFFRESNYILPVVCDGMGGARAGNVASELACTTFTEEMRIAYRPNLSQRAVKSVILSAVQRANSSVFKKSKQTEFFGMGTTLVGGVVTRNRAVIANVGDSRAYIANSSGIMRITRDHSLVEDLLARGELSYEQAKRHPSKNLITRALGTEPEVTADLFTLQLREDDYLLFCSDGLTNVLDEQEMLYEILHGGQPEECCKRLIDIANLRGGPDNITVILISV